MAKIDEVLNEQDAFRLAIRGHAQVEATMTGAIEEAFGGPLPGELRSLPFRTG